MAEDEVLGPRKTMFVLVIVVGCFAVLWPRILSPLILGYSRDQLKPNDFDREAGCCEVIFDSEMAALELINEVCTAAVGASVKNPYTAMQCRLAVNNTCGLDIASFLQRKENIGKSAKLLLEKMRSSNGSCLQENFGVPTWFLHDHHPVNSWMVHDMVKQERPSMRAGGPHPALRERGRAIPPGVLPSRPTGAPAPPSRLPGALPSLARVRSPLSVYYELDIKPPPIPGMRPPLGSPGGPIAAPKSSMGFVMPIYTICIIVFFVYTLSKILFKRSGSMPYDAVPPDDHFQRRVFRDESRTTCENKLVVTAISGLVAEVQQQMEANYAQNQHHQVIRDISQPYSNGSVHREKTPVHIITTEHSEPKKNDTEEIEEKTFMSEKTNGSLPSAKKDVISEAIKQETKHPEITDISNVENLIKEIQTNHEKAKGDVNKINNVNKISNEDLNKQVESYSHNDKGQEKTSDFVTEALKRSIAEEKIKDKKEDEEEVEEEEEEEEVEENEEESENATVKVMGMEMTAHPADGGAWPKAEPRPVTPLPSQKATHEADEVKSIFLETDIPHQSRVLVADFEDHSEAKTPSRHSPLVVSGKMTLSLIQDGPRDTPERELESTMDEFTTASAVTHHVGENQEESEEEIEVEEIEEEVEEEVEEIEEEVEEEVEDEEELNKKKKN